MKTRNATTQASPLANMREALTRPDLFGDQLSGQSWARGARCLLAPRRRAIGSWRLKLFQSVTNRSASPTEPVRDFWKVWAAGRVNPALWLS